MLHVVTKMMVTVAQSGFKIRHASVPGSMDCWICDVHHRAETSLLPRVLDATQEMRDVAVESAYRSLPMSETDARVMKPVA